MSSSYASSFGNAVPPEGMSTSSPMDKASNESNTPVPAVESGTSFSVASILWCHTSEDILLLREVTVHEQPFARGSPAWEEVAANLSDDCERLLGTTARTTRERSLALIKTYVHCR